MLQRVEVARALIARPDVLYMDEPFGALDALTRLRMRSELQRILARDRHTCLLVTHDVEEALHLSDRVMVMTPRPGRIQCIVDVDAPHPRDLSSAPLVALKRRCLSELGFSEGELERDAVSARGARARGRCGPRAGALLPPRCRMHCPSARTSWWSAAVRRARARPRSSPRTGSRRSCSSAKPSRATTSASRCLPALWELWDRLGVTEQIESAGFVVKQGIRFARPGDPRRRGAPVRRIPGVLPARLHLSRRPRALRRGCCSTTRAPRAPTCARDGRSATCSWRRARHGRARRAGRRCAARDRGQSGGRRHGTRLLIARKMGWRRPDPSLNKVAHFTQ
jgi:hypothetical protein